MTNLAFVAPLSPLPHSSCSSTAENLTFEKKIPGAQKRDVISAQLKKKKQQQKNKIHRIWNEKIRIEDNARREPNKQTNKNQNTNDIIVKNYKL